MQQFAFIRPPELDSGALTRYPVVVIGAGPVGLAAANDLAQRGVRTLLLDDDDRLSEGSRAICFAKRSLDIFERLGCVAPMRAKGVTWNVGRIFHHDREVFQFNLQPEGGQAHPAFINLQQYYVEQFLVERLVQREQADIRWRSRVVAHSQSEHGVLLTVETPEGCYGVEADYLIACDGARSPTRQRMGLDYHGVVFEEKFLIADVRMHADFPAERWFWFAPPFHSGHSMLLHRQPDKLWRVDFQLGREADVAEELRPERIRPRIEALLGADAEFELEWASIYAFHSRRLEHFVHGRVIFAGDAAHLMSPFGARGCNSGIQDADNLCWKLALVLHGQAGPALLDSYDHERVAAAQENLLYTESSTRFIAPAGPGALALRDAVLELARCYAFARPLINSGRLSTPCVYADSPLNTPDAQAFAGRCPPGAPAEDAPVALADQPAFLLGQLDGGFTLLCFVDSPADLQASTLAALHALAPGPVPVRAVLLSDQPWSSARFAKLCVLHDRAGYARARYDARPGTCYLLRPDQHVCARWRSFAPAAVAQARDRALGRRP
jgi:3-(3-hydroxy-phenyl)propionate hydroxylase